MKKAGKAANVPFDANTAAGILRGWEAQPFAEPFHEGTLGLKDQRGFLDLFSSEVQPFDCLLLAGWHPAENDLSDALAALFDSRWQHGYPSTILKAVLQTVEAKGSIDPAVRSAISHILSATLGDSGLNVAREKWGENSRADIQIWGPDFFICVEHKAAGGHETMIDGRAQTYRLYEDAVARATALGIAKDRIIGIYLTSDGHAAKNRLFVPISYREFADTVFTAVLKSTRQRSISMAAASILGLMSYYGRS